MSMTAADIAKIAAEAAKAACMRLMTTDATVTPPPASTPKPTAKRKGNPEALKRWRESQKSAAPTAVKAAKPAKAAKPVTVADAETFAGNGAEIELRPGSETKNGRKYVLVYVGGEYCGNLRVDTPKSARAIVNVLRSAAGNDVIAYCDLHG